MPTAASAELIAALSATLADGDAGWAVTSVSETTATRVSDVSGSTTGSVSGSTSGTISGGEGTVTGSTTGSVSGSVSSTSETVVTLTVQLAASALRLADPVAPLRLTYVSIKVDGSFDSALVRCDGAELSSSDGDLDDTVRGMADDFLAAKDAALEAAFGAAPVSASDDPLVMPADMLEALKLSLVNSAHDWYVQNRSEQRVPQPPTVTDGNGRPETRTHLTVSMMSRVTRDASGTVTSGLTVPVGSSLPASCVYMAQLDEVGDLIEAQVMIGGALWRVSDAGLHTTVDDLGDAFLATKSADIVAALTG